MNYWALLASILVLFSSVIAATSMWTSTLIIGGSVPLGSYDPRITSYKLIVGRGCCHCNCSGHNKSHGATVTVDNDNPLTVHFTLKRRHGNATVWLGLVVSNEGSIPFKLKGVESTSPVAVYMYGPFRSLEGSGVWGGVTAGMLPFPGFYTTETPPCPEGMKVVVWVKLLHPAKGTYTITVEAEQFNVKG